MTGLYPVMTEVVADIGRPPIVYYSDGSQHKLADAVDLGAAVHQLTAGELWLTPLLIIYKASRSA